MGTQKILLAGILILATIFGIHFLFYVKILHNEKFNTFYLPGLIGIWLILSTLHYLMSNRKHPGKASIIFLYWSAVKLISGGALFLFLKKNFHLYHPVTLVADFMILYTLSMVYEVWIALKHK